MDADRYSVFGYIRRTQYLFPDGDKFYIVPDSIKEMILSYYLIPECFDGWCPDHVELNEDRTTVKLSSLKTTNLWTKTIYGRKPIVETPHALYQWTFSSIHYNAWLQIGIDSSDCAHVDDDYTDCGNQCPFYSCGPQYKYSLKGGEEMMEHALELNPDTNITMEINTKEKSMKFIVDGISYTVFTDIDFQKDIHSMNYIEFQKYIHFPTSREYKLAIMLGHKDESITLENFEWKRLE